MPPAPSPRVAVAVDGLVKRYGRTEVVHGVDLAAPAGAITALLGPNGAGKTTTVECCEGLRRPDAGRVRVLGLDPVRDARHLRPRVGVMLQDGGLPSTVPAGEALRHVAAMYARPRDLGELGERLGLGSFTRTQVRRLSGGQRQRLALAAAVVGRPDVVFLDEPSAGMDPQARLAVWDLVRELREAGTSIVLTTHQIAEAEALADHVVVVDDGRVIAAGTTAELVGAHDVLRVVVRPTTDDDAPSLTAALADAGRPAEVRSAPSAVPGTLEVVAAADPALVHAVTGWAAGRGALVTSLSAGERTLEDVFLDLTGRRLR
ncbi:ABC transporter ATP-binding protein [Actinotalea ferrariae]|uniref:ABC transporter ATP-binding protein n=1 Tax=Actinotalea ferrariae TaxID=1386098 RepID=UPI001C8C43FB|nr:ABC transporter ATP-binding protein [Actinotalea ferrariae]MBX9245395.1 ABC transporter ATP-binding protein [Actinotalea ferrariae]